MSDYGEELGELLGQKILKIKLSCKSQATRPNKFNRSTTKNLIKQCYFD